MKMSDYHNIKHCITNMPNMTPSFGISISSVFTNMKLDLDRIAAFKIPRFPSRTFSQPFSVFFVQWQRISNQPPLIFRTKFLELLSGFANYTTLFTNGSKVGDTARSACVTLSDTCKCRLLENASIFFFQRKSKLLI